MKQQHICHLVYSFHVGGLERIITNTINSLGVEYTHTIISLTDIGSMIEQIEPEISIFQLNKREGNDYSIYPKLYKILKQLSPDVVHSYNLATFEYQWIAKLLFVPIRLHAEHGRDSYDPYGQVKKYQWIRKFCSLATTDVVAVSAELLNWLEQSVGINQKKLTLIRNGVDTNYFQKSGTTSDFIIGHVARLHAIKNQKMLIDAFDKAKKTNSQFNAKAQLIIVGDGPEMYNLRTYCSSSNITNVKFEGEKTDVLSYYQLFDLFALSSIAEGIPMTLLEAMSVGIPHVVTNVGGIEEVIIKGETGLSCESEDVDTFAEHMITLFLDKTLRDNMSNAAQKRVVSSFSQNRMLNQYKTLYRLR
ncbi:MAG: glycosyltransferase [Aliivibrio sp.]|uniref:glycosyltransferase n=1 Tax=Aliivibrio sp. TaxID=1872443 RepID=UPI001A5DA49F|nr:glycosyltransferase [Aliivibrio sp.]